MNNLHMIFFISALNISFELLLIKTIDVIFDASLGYFIICLALGLFCISGIILEAYQRHSKKSYTEIALNASMIFCLLSSICLPVLRYSTFIRELDLTRSYLASLIFIGFISIPFLLSGMSILAYIKLEKKSIAKIYAADMLGILSAAFLPRIFIPLVGPEILISLLTLIFIFAAYKLLRKTFTFFNRLLFFLILILNILNCLNFDNTRFSLPLIKKYLPKNVTKNQIEISRWDPMARLDVIDYTNPIDNKGVNLNSQATKFLFYNGGTIGSNIYPYNGNPSVVLENYQLEPRKYFTRLATVTAHLLKQNTNYKCYLFGVGAGQEVKAALVFGAEKIYANELVNGVIELNKNEYATFNGQIFNNSKVTTLVGEGRLMLNQTKETFDVIQIFSNYLSSNMAAGLSQIQATYLFTYESIVEYINKLNEDGLLQINQFKHEKILSLLAEYYLKSGQSLDELKKHIYVIQNIKENDILTTILFKKSRFTKTEDLKITNLFKIDKSNDFIFLESPFTLGPSFFNGKNLSDFEKLNFLANDNRPYFAESHFFRNFYGLNLYAFITFVALAIALLIFFQIKNLRKERIKVIGFETIYFFLIGFSFSILQITLIHILLKYLNWQDLSVPLVIGGLSLGSFLSCLAFQNLSAKGALGILCTGLVILLIFLENISGIFHSISFHSNLMTSFLFLASNGLVGLCVGLFFVSGLKIYNLTPDSYSFNNAWLFNGFGILTSCLAIQIFFYKFGHKFTLTIAVLVYIAAYFLLVYRLVKNKSV